MGDGGAAAGGAAGGFIVVMIIFWLLMMIFTIGTLILWIWMLIDCVTRPAWQFPDSQPTGQAKLLWVLVVILGGFIGALVYYFMVHKKMGKANKALPPPPWWFQPQVYPPVQYYQPTATAPPPAPSPGPADSQESQA